MKTFKYPMPVRFLFRYSIVPLTFVLAAYLIVLVGKIKTEPLLIIPALFVLGALILANKYFYNTYKKVPFIITCEKECIKASGFMPGKKPVDIFYSDIDYISGGVFGLNSKGIIYIHDGRQNLEIGIHPDIQGVDELLKFILNRVNKELRDELTEKLRRNERQNV